MGRLDPENSEGTVCLDDGPRHRVWLFERSVIGVTVGVGVDRVVVAYDDGGVSARFEVGFVSRD